MVYVSQWVPVSISVSGLTIFSFGSKEPVTVVHQIILLLVVSVSAAVVLTVTVKQSCVPMGTFAPVAKTLLRPERKLRLPKSGTCQTRVLPALALGLKAPATPV